MSVTPVDKKGSWLERSAMICLCLLVFVFWVPTSLEVVAEVVSELAAIGGIVLLALVAILVIGSSLYFVALPTSRHHPIGQVLWGCFWLLLVWPTFGLVPILAGTGFIWDIPGGQRLVIYLGFVLTSCWNALYPSQTITGIDHPSPPIPDGVIWAIAIGTTAIAILALRAFWQVYRAFPQPAQPN